MASAAKPRAAVANLSKGRVGEQRSNLLALLLSHLQLVAMARSDLVPENRAPFFVHVDEFQSFASDTVASLFSEARKFACHFCCANQFTAALSPKVLASVLGNAGTLMAFGVSAADAEVLSPEFRPLPAHELNDQSPYRAWLRRSDTGHRAVLVSPRLYDSPNNRDKVVAQSRRNFGRSRSVIENQRC